MRASISSLAAWLLLVSAAVAQGQNATVTGRVVDPSNAVISAAKVNVINEQTNVRFTSVTNAEGIYQLASLVPGTYRIEVSKPNFKTIIKPDLVLHVQDVIALNFTLTIGSTSESITVEAGVPLIETESSAVG